MNINMKENYEDELKLTKKDLSIRSIVEIDGRSQKEVITLAYILEFPKPSDAIKDILSFTGLKEPDAAKKSVENLLNNGREDLIKEIKERPKQLSQLAEILLKDSDLDIWTSAARALKLTIIVYYPDNKKWVYVCKEATKEIVIVSYNENKYSIISIDKEEKERRQIKELRIIKKAIQNLAVVLKSPNIETVYWFINKWQELVAIFSKEEKYKDDIAAVKNYIEFLYKSLSYIMQKNKENKEGENTEQEKKEEKEKKKEKKENSDIKGSNQKESKKEHSKEENVKESKKEVEKCKKYGHDYNLPKDGLGLSMEAICSECNHIASDEEIKDILKPLEILCVYEKDLARCMFCRERENIVKVHNDHYLCRNHLEQVRRASKMKVLKCPARNCEYRFIGILNEENINKFHAGNQGRLRLNEI